MGEARRGSFIHRHYCHGLKQHIAIRIGGSSEQTSVPTAAANLSSNIPPGLAAAAVAGILSPGMPVHRKAGEQTSVAAAAPTGSWEFCPQPMGVQVGVAPKFVGMGPKPRSYIYVIQLCWHHTASKLLFIIASSEYIIFKFICIHCSMLFRVIY